MPFLGKRDHGQTGQNYVDNNCCSSNHYRQIAVYISQLLVGRGFGPAAGLLAGAAPTEAPVADSYFFAVPGFAGHTTPWSAFVTGPIPLYTNFCTR